MNKVHLDFESRSACDLIACGAWVYSKHPTTKILCASWALNDEPPRLITFENLRSKILRDLAADENNLFYAHNASFELYMWMHLMLKIGYPEIALHRWRCTSAKMAAMGLPKSLEHAGKAFGLEIQKDSAGHAVMMRLCKPVSAPKNLKHFQLISEDMGYDNDPEKFQKLFAYCKNDIVVERSLDNKSPELSKFEQRIWYETMKINISGIQMDTELVDSVIRMNIEFTEAANLRVQQLTNDKIKTFNQVLAISQFLESRGFHTDSLTVDDLDPLLELTKNDPICHELLEIRKSMARSSVQKFFAFQRQLDSEDKRIRDVMIYHLSHTGRWGSRGAQMLNLVKFKGDMEQLCYSIKKYDKTFLDVYWGNANHAISDSPRGALIASPGNQLFCADFSAIEARTLFFIAREAKGILQFMRADADKNEPDIYVLLARIIYGDESITKKQNPEERQMGKQGVLGCGYQMGWERFQETCATYDIEVAEELAKTTVNAYRTTYTAVADFWKECEAAAKYAIKYRTTVEIGCIAFGYSAGALLVRLPSGKFLYFHNPIIKKRTVTEEQREKLIEKGLEWKLEKEVINYHHQNAHGHWVQTHTYGGKLVENINQAVARELLAFALINVTNTGRYRPLLLPHDEFLTEGNPNECSVEELCRIVCQLPRWADGLPMAAEGWAGMRYKKG